MNVDNALLNRLEKLSMIKIDESKKESFKSELSEIIAKMESLQEVNTDNLESIIRHGSPLREDITHNANVKNSILKIAPQVENDYFIVPKIL